MRKLKSVVALASVLAVMACQTAVASTSVRRSLTVAPASGIPSSSATAPAQKASTESHTSSTAVAAASPGSRKAWIIAGVIAAIVIVALIVAGTAGSGSAY